MIHDLSHGSAADTPPPDVLHPEIVAKLRNMSDPAFESVSKTVDGLIDGSIDLGICRDAMFEILDRLNAAKARAEAETKPLSKAFASAEVDALTEVFKLFEEVF